MRDKYSNGDYLAPTYWGAIKDPMCLYWGANVKYTDEKTTNLLTKSWTKLEDKLVKAW